jgi:DNA-binding CsgD family transcriptional regulator
MGWVDMESTGSRLRPDPIRVALATLSDIRRSGAVFVGPPGSGKTHALQGVVRGLGNGRKVSTQPAVLAVAGMRPRAVRALLEPGQASTAAAGRRILAVDDLDRWSPSLLQLLSDAVDQRRVQVVATVRSSALEQLLGRFRPADVPVLVELHPWGTGDLSHHARAVLDAPLHPVTAAALVEFSGGNPLCLAEMIELGRATGRLQRRHDVWAWSPPMAVPPVTEARVWSGLASQPPAVRDVLATLATAGPLPLRALVRIHPPAAVTDADERGWLLSRPDPAGVRVQLRRHLDGQVAAARVSMLRRRALDAALAEALVLDGAGDSAAMVAAAAACARGGIRLPEDVRLRAGAAALRRHQPALAVELTEGSRAGTAVTLRAAALVEQGRFTDAAVALAGDPGDPGDDAVPKDPVAALCADAWSGRGLTAVVVAGRALLDGPELPGRSRLLCLLATSWASLQLGQVEQALGLTRAAPTAAPGTEHTAPECLLMYTAGLAQLVLGSTREAGSHGARLCRTGIEEQWHLAYALGAHLHGLAAGAEARPELARRRLSESAASLALAVPAVQRRPVLQELTLVRRQSGRDPDPPGGGVADDASTTPAPRLVTELGNLAEAEGLLLAGRRRSALDLAGLVADRARAEGWPLVRLQALHLVARIEPSASVVEELTRAAGQADFDLADRYRAHAAAAVGDDRTGMADAAEHYEALGLRWLAGETAATALAGVESSPLSAGWAARAKRVLGRLQQEDDVVLPDWWGSASARVLPLTPREREIAEAAVRGETSAQIAERLSLSRRTVENHLQHVYRKLGVSHRGDLELAYGTVVPRGSGRGSAARR